MLDNGSLVVSIIAAVIALTSLIVSVAARMRSINLGSGRLKIDVKFDRDALERAKETTGVDLTPEQAEVYVREALGSSGAKVRG